jgi:hypothetical protein
LRGRATGCRPGWAALTRSRPSTHAPQLPYDYYSLPFCRPEKVINKVENLGEVLHGSVIQVPLPHAGCPLPSAPRPRSQARAQIMFHLFVRTAHAVVQACPY